MKKEKNDYEQRIQDVEELKSNLVKYEEESEDPDLYDFLEEISLLTDVDNYDQDADSVVLMTMHSAKGLEFPVVFIPGMEDGIFPGVQSLYDENEMEEERRLAYVAITRAKEELFMIKSSQRLLYGSTKHNRASTFLNEIPLEYIEMSEFKPTPQNREVIESIKPKSRIMASAKNFSRPAAPAPAPVPVKLKEGDIVEHAVFGRGEVLSFEEVGNDTVISIKFDKAGVKMLLGKTAKLKKI